jgi:Ca2+-binding RTX toxin-like protein
MKKPLPTRVKKSESGASILAVIVGGAVFLIAIYAMALNTRNLDKEISLRIAKTKAESFNQMAIDYQSALIKSGKLVIAQGLTENAVELGTSDNDLAPAGAAWAVTVTSQTKKFTLNACDPDSYTPTDLANMYKKAGALVPAVSSCVGTNKLVSSVIDYTAIEGDMVVISATTSVPVGSTLAVSTNSARVRYVPLDPCKVPTATNRVLRVGDDLVVKGHDTLATRMTIYNDVSPSNCRIRIDYTGFVKDYIRARMPGKVIFCAGSGNDQVTGNNAFKGEILAYLGDGDDYFASGSSLPSTVYGEGGDDSIESGSIGTGDDYFDGGPGNDSLSGGKGNDILIGGPGNDQISGAEGDDILFGGPGNDTIGGSSGDDIVVGGDGVDSLTGGAGMNLLIGGAGLDSMSGSGGNQVLIANSTIYDDDIDSLRLLLEEWRSANNYTTRVTNLTNGGGLNGTVSLGGANVIADGEAETCGFCTLTTDNDVRFPATGTF